MEAATNEAQTPSQSPPCQGGEVLSVARRLRWVLLSFAPSSLMLSVTTYLTTDIAAIPLLWVIPLAIYLLTFILVFARRPLLRHFIMVRALPIVLLPLIVVLAVRAVYPMSVLIPLHLATFFVVAMVCHGELAQDRPAARHLTEFYLWLSVGGVLGGAFNALVAPLLFNSVVEYPLVLVLACLLLRPQTTDDIMTDDTQQRQLDVTLLDVMLPLALGLLTLGLVLGVQSSKLQSQSAATGLMFGLPALLVFSFSRRPLRFALGVAAILLASTFLRDRDTQILRAERSFFGIHRVVFVNAGTGQFHRLMHGSTLHGLQNLNPVERDLPLTYYHPTGPIGQVFDKFNHSLRAVAVVGLGAGSLASYSRRGQHWTFYEIDPVVERLARDARYFTFLRDGAAPTQVTLGDARLSLAAAPNRYYDLIVLDAYSSDAIPVHLLTREALQLYLDKLAADGILAFHISNRHFELQPLMAALAQDAALVCLAQDEQNLTKQESAQGKTASHWVVMARRKAALGTLSSDTRWRPPPIEDGLMVWTDSYSSLLGVFKWQ